MSAPPPLAPPPVAPGRGLAAGAGAAKLAVTGLAAVDAVGAAAVVAVVGFGVGRHRAPALERPAPAGGREAGARVPEPLENADDIPIAETAPPPPVCAVAAPPPPHARRRRPRPSPRRPPRRVEAPSDAASRLREEAALVQRAERLLDADPAARSA